MNLIMLYFRYPFLLFINNQSGFPCVQSSTHASVDCEIYAFKNFLSGLEDLSLDIPGVLIRFPAFELELPCGPKLLQPHLNASIFRALLLPWNDVQVKAGTPVLTKVYW